MNIFATGMNPSDANALKRAPRVAIFQVFPEMIEGLESLGHTVEWRRLKVGEDLPSRTDAVLVSSMLPRSLNCPYALGVIWAMSEALRLDIPLVVYLTDWAFFKAHSEFRSIAKAGQPYFSKTIGGALQYAEDPAMIERYSHRLLAVCCQYNDPSSPFWKKAQIVVPRYTSWGDVSIIQRLLPGANPVHTLDPTPIFVDYLNVYRTPNLPMTSRLQEWILPSLLKNDDWLVKQNLKWPIKRFGPKGFPVLPTERDIHKEYQCHAGAICPPYPTVGSGWWRTRWIHSALAGSVLLCDVKDGQQLGPAYTFSGTRYEQMGPGDFADVAAYQQDTLGSVLQLRRERFIEQLAAPFEEVGL